MIRHQLEFKCRLITFLNKDFEEETMG
uniref:Uncharacterized protein n=1 Tax=Lepeophtheirus salmonis TaxID=72036 RepID=A0A0K2UIC1_LEPSM